MRYIKNDISKDKYVENLVSVVTEQKEVIDSLTEYMGVKVDKIDDHQYKVIKDVKAKGDYTDPIPYNVGDSVEVGNFYYSDDYDYRLECIKSGIPTSFYDKEYFDVI